MDGRYVTRSHGWRCDDAHGWVDRYMFLAISALPPSVAVVCHKEPVTYMDVGSYDSKEGIGRVESGTETENNAGAVIKMAV